MSDNISEISEQEISSLADRLNREAESAGYHLNPDIEFTRELLEGLIINQKRYGYMACPCRLAAGEKQADLDIICPCDYRDPDLNEFESCYCALYVSQNVLDGIKTPEPIPERRQSGKKSTGQKPVFKLRSLVSLDYPVWRCRVCGYLCAREGPPEVCPICKAKKDRFETFLG
jgi:ferredoxin-thioredoxin reductase catalytic chain